jgi:hypothetical protein
LVPTDGVLSGHTAIESQGGRLAATGQILVEKPRLSGIDLGYPITADYRLSDDLTNELLWISEGALNSDLPPFLSAAR